MAVSLDGVMVPMKAGQRKEKRAAAAAAGKPTRGPAGYCEAACATVTVYDHERAPLHTVRMGRMPESKKATIKGMLCDELAAVVAARPELEIVAVADGARDNWRYFDANCRGQPRSLTSIMPLSISGWLSHRPTVRARRDTSHSSRSCGTSSSTKLEASTRSSVRSATSATASSAQGTTPGSEVLPTQPAPDALPGVHRTGLAHRLRNGRSRLQDPCDTALKRSGMRWNTDGGQAILTFRSAAQSQRFDRAWNLVASAYRTDVTPVDNVFPFQPRRAA